MCVLFVVFLALCALILWVLIPPSIRHVGEVKSFRYTRTLGDRDVSVFEIVDTSGTTWYVGTYCDVDKITIGTKLEFWVGYDVVMSSESTRKEKNRDGTEYIIPMRVDYEELMKYRILE